VQTLPEAPGSRFTDPQSPVEMLTGGATELASLYFQPRIGGDLAVVKDIIKVLLETDALDHAFVAEHTDGYAALRDEVLAEGWPAIEASWGLTEAQIRQAAAVYAKSNATICTWGMASPSTAIRSRRSR
jgi:anaerobic selenocysteine-containing dehydrogenase